MNRRHEENDIVAMAWRTIQWFRPQKMHCSTVAAACALHIDC